MKRFLAALSLTIAGLAFVLGFKTRDAIPPQAVDSTPLGGGSTVVTAVTTTTQAGSTDSVASTTAATTTTAAATPIEVDGPTVETRYGPVQVAAVVEGGALVEVVALQLPGGNGESNAINAYAEPRLREMALQAQSAQIDVVSGATFTSLAYAQSLQAALDQAGM